MCAAAVVKLVHADIVVVMAFYSSVYPATNSASWAQSYESASVREYLGGDPSYIVTQLSPHTDRFITFINYFPEGETREKARARTETLLIGDNLSREKREIWLTVRSMLSGHENEAIGGMEGLGQSCVSAYTSACLQVLQWVLTDVTDQGIHQYLEAQENDHTVQYLVLEFASARAILKNERSTASGYLLEILENLPDDMILEQIYEYCSPDSDTEALDEAIETAEKQGEVVPAGWLEFRHNNCLFSL